MQGAVSIWTILLLAGVSNVHLQTLLQTPIDDPHFWVTFPTRIRPNMKVSSTLKLLYPGVTASVSIFLRNNSNQQEIVRSTQTVSGGGRAQVIEIQIPKLKPAQLTGDFSMHVEGTGDVTFSGSAKVKLSEKIFSIFVQTDKAIYKPGQTVKLRALAMNPDLTVLKERMNVLIEDPNGNGIRQWYRAEGVSNTGVVELSMPTSQYPPLGLWSIFVTVLGYTKKKTFTIDEYVLPTFEAKLDLPTYALTGVPSFTGTVSSKYTYGKPLTKADVVITATLETAQRVLNKTGTLDAKGEMNFSITIQELLTLNLHANTVPDPSLLDNKTLTVIANITDTRTGHKTSAVSTIQLYKYPAIATFLPISANTFKPGLDYKAYLSVTKPDGSLFTNLNSTIVQFEVTITVSGTSTGPSRENRILPANGFIPYEVTVPARATKLTITATVMGMTAIKTVSNAVSPSNNFLQIQIQTENPRVGQRVEFIAKATEALPKITYQIFSKSLMLETAEVVSTVLGGSQTLSFSFLMDINMAPYCRLLVFYIRPNGEVVADSISFKVDAPSQNPISLTFNKEQVKPGEEVDLTIRAQPSSAVFMLSVDKSVLLLKSGNDITQNLVSEELTGYDYVPEYRKLWRYLSIYSLPYSSSGSNANNTFTEINVAIITGRVQLKTRTVLRVPGTNGVMSVVSATHNPPPDRLVSAVSRDSVLNGLIKLTSDSIVVDTENRDNERNALPEEEDLTPVERVRKFFPETWLFDFVILNNTGSSVQRKTAPDTITTWLTTAFAVHPQFGLSVLPEAAKLTTFRNVFLSLDLPYSVLRGEDLCFKAFAFNYYHENIVVTMTMERNDAINVISMVSDSRFTVDFVESRSPMRISHNIGVVPPQQIRETMYCISPTKVGKFTLQVSLRTTTIPGDSVEHVLLVETEGFPRTETVSVILSAVPGQTFTQSVPVNFPSDVVQGSQRITVTVSGDVMAPVFQNLGDLLRMPSGCGEQNMLNFAPNVFLLDYMQRTNTYSPEITSRAQNYMLTGYQKELQYQHRDGSFSAFGQSDTSGSMWLTAFVTKCFIQSTKLNDDVIKIDPNIIKKSILWMTSRQGQTGVFPEPGNVIHKEMQGGSGSGEALTAFVLIALGEAQISFPNLNSDEATSLRNSISRGRSYLESRVRFLTDTYHLAIVTYALHLVGSPVADDSFNRLANISVRENSTMHWERPNTGAQQLSYSWERKTDAITIETTAYALLTYIKRQNIAGALSITRWMTKQRGPLGGFISTQDTVIGLQSLAEAAAATYSPIRVPIDVTISWTAGGQRHSTNKQISLLTMQLVQSVEISIQDNNIPTAIQISADTRGNYAGLAATEVILNYNVLESPRFNTYSLTQGVRMTDYDNLVLDVEASRIDGKTGGMTLIEVGLPTGYEVDVVHSEYNIRGSTLVETLGRKCVLYYNQLGPSPVRIALPMRAAASNAVNLKPSLIRVVDYYENGAEQQKINRYELPMLKNNLVCDRQPEYENCPFFTGGKI